MGQQDRRLRAARSDEPDDAGRLGVFGLPDGLGCGLDGGDREQRRGVELPAGLPGQPGGDLRLRDLGQPGPAQVVGYSSKWPEHVRRHAGDLPFGRVPGLYTARRCAVPSGPRQRRAAGRGWRLMNRGRRRAAGRRVERHRQ